MSTINKPVFTRLCKQRESFDNASAKLKNFELFFCPKTRLSMGFDKSLLKAVPMTSLFQMSFFTTQTNLRGF